MSDARHQDPLSDEPVRRHAPWTWERGDQAGLAVVLLIIGSLAWALAETWRFSLLP